MKTNLLIAGLVFCAICFADGGLFRRERRKRIKFVKRDPTPFIDRLNKLEHIVVKLEDRLERVETLEKRVVHVEKRGCETGRVEAIVCDANSYYDFCTFQYLIYGELKIAYVPIKLKSFFKEKPVVTAGLSGIFTEAGKNCTVAVKEVTPYDFQIQIVLGGPKLPYTLNIFWYACDGKPDGH